MSAIVWQSLGTEHLLRQRGEGVVVLIGEELQLEQDGAGGH